MFQLYPSTLSNKTALNSAGYLYVTVIIQFLGMLQLYEKMQIPNIYILFKLKFLFDFSYIILFLFSAHFHHYMQNVGPFRESRLVKLPDLPPW